MRKLEVKALSSVFDWLNIRARDFADSFGNRSATRENIALVMQAAGNVESKRGYLEMAFNAMNFKANTSGTSGRRWKPSETIFPKRELNLG